MFSFKTENISNPLYPFFTSSNLILTLMQSENIIFVIPCHDFCWTLDIGHVYIINQKTTQLNLNWVIKENFVKYAQIEKSHRIVKWYTALIKVSPTSRPSNAEISDFFTTLHYFKLDLTSQLSVSKNRFVKRLLK